MPPRTRAQRRRAQRDRRRAARKPVQAHVRWRDVPNAVRDWSELTRAQRTAAAARIVAVAATLILSVVSVLIGVALYGELVVRPAEPVSSVNGAAIPASRYADFLALRRFELSRELADLPTSSDPRDPSHPQAQLATLTISAVTELTNAQLMRAEAATLGVRIDDQAVSGALYEFVSGPGEVADDFDFRAAFAEIRDQTRLDSRTIRGFIADRALADAVADHLAANLDPAPPQIRASQIVVATEEAAETVIARLDAYQPFELVAEQASIDAESASDGGDLGWLPRGLMPDGWDEAAFALRPGGRSQPTSTPQGWHVILVHEQSESRPLDPAAAERRRQVTYDNWLQTLRATAEVEFLLSPEIIDWATRR
ncbi:MAG: peptidylprolyl isomerase [Chloroflexota bacterium]|nr:peptidylprolyl isomerase [Chloroflexota bacterium]MDE2919366.1 peptidylprolyl isomerase [Chloroflexota bacterium]